VGIVLVTNVASQTAAAYQVDIRVGYDRTSGEAVTLTEKKLTVAGGEQQIPITVDLAPCLADPNRGAARDSCSLMEGITLLDATGNVLDTQSQGPLIASPGKAAVSIGATLNSHFTLSVVTAGAGSGTVQLSPVSNVNATGATYVPHTAVTLTAVAGASSAFAGWSGDCTGSGTTCVLTMDANKNVTATFNPRYTLTITTTGSGTGTVSANPPGPAYAPGTSVTLTASPASGSSFSGWSGACSGSGTTCTLTMDANKSVTATFLIIPRYTLALSTTGSGSGAVTTNPAAPDYASGTVVTLTASPASGSSFSGWSGDCSGSSTTCVVTMDANRSVTATFVLIPVVSMTGTWSGQYAVTESGGTGPSGLMTVVLVQTGANVAGVATFVNSDGSSGGPSPISGTTNGLTAVLVLISTDAGLCNNYPATFTISVAPSALTLTGISGLDCHDNTDGSIKSLNPMTGISGSLLKQP
jgi:hypothetical protein